MRSRETVDRCPLSAYRCPAGSSARNALAHPCLRGGWRAQRAGRGQQVVYIIIAAKRRYHNPLNPLNPLNPHAAGVSMRRQPPPSSRAGGCAGMGVDVNRFDDTLSLKISHRNAARTIRGGEISPLRSATVEMTGTGAAFLKSASLKGKRLTTFCASLALLHPLLSLTHWIFRSLMLPYKSSSHSAKCVRYAPRGATITLSGRAAVAP